MTGHVLHHIGYDGEHHTVYINKLAGMKPALIQLTQTSRVIWLNQYSTLGFLSSFTDLETLMSPDKIVIFNRMVQELLEYKLSLT